MTFRDYVRILRKRWVSLAVLALVGVAAAAAASLSATPAYQATSGVYFSIPTGTSGSDLSQGSSYTQSQMLSYAELATQPLVLEEVISDLGLGVTPLQLSRTVTAEASPNTVILHLSASDPSPRQAARIANSLADRLSATVQRLSPRSASGTPTITAEIVEEAVPPVRPSSPKTVRNAVAGLLAGILLGVLFALGREVLDTRVRSREDVERLTPAPVLGEVVRARSARAHEQTMFAAGTSLEAEAYRRVRTNLGFLGIEDRPLTLVLTSALAGEGKSSICTNLGQAISRSSTRVLLIDADLRRPAIHRYTGLEGAVGLTTVLIGEADVEDVIQPWGPNLDVLAAGSVPPNPSELLGSRAMDRVLEEVRGRYDVILIDAPPLLPVTDAAILSTTVSGAVLVASCSKVHRAELTDALSALDRVDARVLGIIVNEARPGRTDHYHYGHPEPSSRWARLTRPRGDRRDRGRAAPAGERHRGPGPGAPAGVDDGRPAEAERASTR